MQINVRANLKINASAADVWQVIAHQFEDIGLWASAIPHSTPLAAASATDNAPVAGRQCHTQIRGFETIEERFLYYDEAAQRFGYSASQMPSFVTQAENHWSVTAVDGTTSIVHIDGRVSLKAWPGILAWPFMRLQLAIVGRRTASELRHFIETGQPHPRKARQLARRPIPQS